MGTVATPIRLAAGLMMLAGAGPLSAQGTPDLEAGLHAVLAHGDLLDLQALSTDLGIEIYLPPTDDGAQIFRGTVTRSPLTMYATGLSFTVQINKSPPRTHVQLNFTPRECSGLQNWGKDWNKPVELGMLTDAAGSWSNIRWGGPEGITLGATYFTNGGCAFDLQQTINRDVPLRFTKAPPQPAQAQFDQKIAEIVQHGDLRDYQWSANVLNVDLQAGRSGLRNGRLFKGDAKLTQVIPGVRADSFYYYANDTGWTNFPGTIVYAGQKIAERFVQLSFAFETQQVCLPPADIAASLQHLGIPYRTDSNTASVRYVVEGDNEISMTVETSQERQCVANVTLRQTTDARHNIKTPVEFRPQDSLEADRLSGAAVRRIDLIAERLQDKTVKQVTLFMHPVAKTDQPDQTLAHLADLLRAALVEKGVPSELIQSQETPAWMLQGQAEASIAVDVLAR